MFIAFLLLSPQSVCKTHSSSKIYTTQNKFCISFKHVCIVLLVKKFKLIYPTFRPTFLSAQKKPGRMVVVCLVQRLLEERKQSNPLSLTSHISRFENYCLQLIIMGNYMQVLVPK